MKHFLPGREGSQEVIRLLLAATEEIRRAQGTTGRTRQERSSVFSLVGDRILSRFGISRYCSEPAFGGR